ncbi:MAG: PilZ domain-containing protein [Pseudomonadota bacterium]
MKIKGPSALEYRPYKLANISATGLAASLLEAIPPFHPGDLCKARILIKDQPIEFSIKVIFVDKNLMGFAIPHPNALYVSSVVNYFKTEFSALHSNPMAIANSKTEMDGEPFCFKGGDNFQLYFVAQSDQVKKFKLEVWGDTVEMDDQGEMHANRQIPKETLQLGQRFVHSMVGPALIYKTQILEKLSHLC